MLFPIYLSASILFALLSCQAIAQEEEDSADPAEKEQETLSQEAENVEEPSESLEAISNPSGQILLNNRQLGKIINLKDRESLTLDTAKIGKQSLKKGIKLVVLNSAYSEILAYLEIIKLNRGKTKAIASIQQSNFLNPNDLIGLPLALESNIEDAILEQYLKSLALDSLLRPGKRTATVEDAEESFIYFDTKKLRQKPFAKGERFVVLDEEATTVLADLIFITYPKPRAPLGKAKVVEGIHGKEAVPLIGMPVAYHQHIDKRATLGGISESSQENAEDEGKGRRHLSVNKKNMSGLSVRTYGTPLRNPTILLGASYIATPYPLLDRLLERSTNNQVNWLSYSLSLAPPNQPALPYLNWFVLSLRRGSLQSVKITIKAQESVGNETIVFSGSKSGVDLCIKPNVFQMHLLVELCPLVSQQSEEILNFSGNNLSDADEIKVTTKGNTAKVGARYYGFYPMFIASDINVPIKQKVTLDFGGDVAKAERKSFIWHSQLGWQKRFGLTDPSFYAEAAFDASFIQDRIETNANVSLIDFDYADSAFSYGMQVGLGYSF